MASISSLIHLIRTAVKAKEVRDAIADGMKQTYDDASKNGNANMEVSIARGAEENLNSRLNKMDDKDVTNSARLDRVAYEKADQSFVDAQLSAIVSGAPTATYATLSDLQSAHPNGSQGVFLVLENGHWYHYNTDVNAWQDGGVYKADGVQDGSITMEKISREALEFRGYKVINKGFNNVHVGIKFAFDIRQLNLTGKKVKFGFNFHTDDIRASTFHARYRLSNQLEGIADHPNQFPFESSDGISNVIDSSAIYDYQDNERTSLGDANYLFCYIWVNLKDQVNDFSFYYRNMRLSIDGNYLMPVLIEPHGGSIITQEVKTLNNQLSTIGYAKVLADEVIRKNRDFNGVLSSVSDFNNTYFAICYSYDVRDINFNNAKVDVTFNFNADHPDIDRVHSRYRLSSSPNALENPVTPFSDGQAIRPNKGEIYEYIDLGRRSEGNGAYFLVYIWVPVKGTLNYGSLFHTLPEVKINGTIRTPVSQRAHSGTMSQAKVERLPSQLMTGRNKHETIITPYSNMDIALTGDSLTDSNGGFTSKYWHQHVQDELQFKAVYNYGIGGSTIGKKDGGTANNPIIDRYHRMIAASIMGIWASTNDYSRGVELGTFNSRDTATFYGAYHSLLEGMINLFPNAKLFTMTPLPRVMDGPREGSPYHLYQYADAVKEVSAAHSVPCHDLFYSSGMHPKNEKHLELYFADGVHPNDLGHERFAPGVTQFIKTL